MITLKTLPEATAQEVFDQIALHMLNQRKKSGDDANCYYRHNDLKCAAGCLIADDEYSENMECLDWSDLAIERIVPMKHSRMIRKLQRIHDGGRPEDWKDRLRRFAEENNLKFIF
jgi:hypothetical protein